MVKNKIKILKVRASWPICYENQIEFKVAVSLNLHLQKSSLKCLRNPGSSLIPLNGTGKILL